MTYLSQVPDSPDVPWCYYPPNYSYHIEGEVIDTATGLLATLRRNDGIGSMVGGDFDMLFIEAEFQTAERLRIKIR